jgi:hypothetical protein
VGRLAKTLRVSRHSISHMFMLPRGQCDARVQRGGGYVFTRMIRQHMVTRWACNRFRSLFLIGRSIGTRVPAMTSQRSWRTGAAALLAMLITSIAAPHLRAQGIPHDSTLGARPDTGAGMNMDMSTPMSMSPAPLGIAVQRTGSGTSWQPDATPMRASQSMIGGWDVMLHGVAFLQYDHQGSQRGANQLGSVNWGMIQAGHSLANGTLNLRGMISAEPFTVGGRGYPLLLQSGEAYRGQPLHDRQHPHDLFMEIAGLYDRALGKNLALSLYLAPVGEPAVGPVAFPHRASASNNPFAPLGHHWQDATHISFGVITTGIYTRTLKLEGSIFNGREPDDVRTNFDFKGRSLDSYAARLTVNPNANLSLSGSYAYLKSPEQLDPLESVHRIVASAMYSRSFRETGYWASTFVYGANRHAGESGITNSVLVESNLDLDNRNAIFGRAELVQKSSGDLVIEPEVVFAPTASTSVVQQPRLAATMDARQFNVGEISLGYVRELTRLYGGSVGIGITGAINIIPSSLEHVYGSRTPMGGAIFLRVRPGLMSGHKHTTAERASPMHGMHDTHDTGSADRNEEDGIR